MNTDNSAENLPEGDYRYAPNINLRERDNKLIAEFMGASFNNEEQCWMYAKETAPTKHSSYKWDAYAMEYHERWDWLMPVVEKICKLKIGDGKTYVDYAYPRTFGMFSEGEPGVLMVRLNGFFIHYNESLLKATYDAVVEFVKHYTEMEKTIEPR